MGQKMCHSDPDYPDQYVFYCFPLLMTTSLSKKEAALGKGWGGLIRDPAKRVCESPVARGERNDLWEWTQTQDKNSELEEFIYSAEQW